MGDFKLRTLRYKGRCARCTGTIHPGDRGYYERASRRVYCARCGPYVPNHPRPNAAGASAGREYDRRRSARERRLDDALPFGGRLIARLSEPQHQVAWATGAAGERAGARALEKHLQGSCVRLLHDVRKPTGGGNIDHVAMGIGGVTVIDSKKLKGSIRVRSKGLLRPRAELRVAGRDRSALVTGVQEQVRAVREVLTESGLPDVDVRGALQFIDGDLPWFGLEDMDGVTLGRPRKVAELVRRVGPLSAPRRSWRISSAS
jgi:Zn finger protein HypA/HybF involved in hydrogenase expression